MKFYCDKKRHLVCSPYTIDNLHKMAEILGIKRHWFHSKEFMSHYDIPKTRLKEIMQKCIVVRQRDIVKIIRCGDRVYEG